MDLPTSGAQPFSPQDTSPPEEDKYPGRTRRYRRERSFSSPIQASDKQDAMSKNNEEGGRDHSSIFAGESPRINSPSSILSSIDSPTLEASISEMPSFLGTSRLLSPTKATSNEYRMVVIQKLRSECEALRRDKVRQHREDQTKIEELEDLVSSLRKQKQSLEITYTDVLVEIQKIKQDISNNEEEYLARESLLEKQLQLERETSARLTETVEDLEHERAQLAAEMKEKDKLIDTLEEELLKVRQKLQAFDLQSLQVEKTAKTEQKRLQKLWDEAMQKLKLAVDDVEKKKGQLKRRETKLKKKQNERQMKPEILHLPVCPHCLVGGRALSTSQTGLGTNIDSFSRDPTLSVTRAEQRSTEKGQGNEGGLPLGDGGAPGVPPAVPLSQQESSSDPKGSLQDSTGHLHQSSFGGVEGYQQLISHLENDLEICKKEAAELRELLSAKDVSLRDREDKLRALQEELSHAQFAFRRNTEELSRVEMTLSELHGELSRVKEQKTVIQQNYEGYVEAFEEEAIRRATAELQLETQNQANHELRTRLKEAREEQRKAERQLENIFAFEDSDISHQGALRRRAEKNGRREKPSPDEYCEADDEDNRVWDESDLCLFNTLSPTKRKLYLSF